MVHIHNRKSDIYFFSLSRSIFHLVRFVFMIKCNMKECPSKAWVTENDQQAPHLPYVLTGETLRFMMYIILHPLFSSLIQKELKLWFQEILSFVNFVLILTPIICVGFQVIYQVVISLYIFLWIHEFQDPDIHSHLKYRFYAHHHCLNY